jgi:hypothetical protein
MPNIDISIDRISARAEAADKVTASSTTINPNLFIASPWNVETAGS